MDEKVSQLGSRATFRFKVFEPSIDHQIARLKQVHGCTGVRAPFDREEEGDWIWTNSIDLPIGIRVADCTAILLTGRNREGDFVAAIHAGWRGTAARIIETAIETLQPENEWSAWISPALCQTHFEVGPEVLEQLGPRSTDFAKPSGRESHSLLDLRGYQERVLQERGGRVIRSTECTFCDSDLPSYRRDLKTFGRDTGRRAIAIIQLLDR